MPGNTLSENIDRGAYQLDLKGFQNVYTFVRHYAERHENDVQVILFTVQAESDVLRSEINEALNMLDEAVYMSLRRNDVSTRYSDTQIVVLLMDANSDNGEAVARRIIECYKENCSDSRIGFSYDNIKIEGSNLFSSAVSNQNVSKKILVVDDDKTNLMAAKNALDDLYDIAPALSGEKALAFLAHNACDLILLDLAMPDMDGFETMKKIREIPSLREIPVIFLTGDKNAETEKKCLKEGAVDYIQKPFVPEVLRARIERILELFELRNGLRQKVIEKTEKIETQGKSIISALAGTVDAKDRYTSGHSQRVAQYSKMLAAKMGKTHYEQDEIYQAGLLHDVGKIRVPEAIINKPEKLNDEEFEMIKLHPINGYHILREISDEKMFSEGARFHHERYDGKGYPNGLSGDQIPEIARIVGIADAYDAMTSNRSYRNALPQKVVREEIEKGKGAQFDPVIADIMLMLIDEDSDYKMREMPMDTKKLLVVDDEPVNITIVETFLKDSDIYTVRSCTGCADALDVLGKEHFDIVLLDIEMPEMDGFEFAESLRKFSDVPIVLMTADKSLIDMEQLKKYNIADFIIRPFKPVVLSEILHAVLRMMIRQIW